MASTETRPTFRLPWSAGPAESDEHDQVEPMPTKADADASQFESTTDGADAPEPEETQADDMIETAAPPSTPSQSESSGAVPARRATKFMAELSHAMQAAAEHARSETMERFEAEAKAVVEEIHASATTEVADLRRKADDDVAAIREWSKAEIARIREETETRVAARKTGLDAEMDAHTATVEARAERVGAVVAAFAAEMSAFFDRLNSEEDPTRIATMAETMPDPPSLEAVVASIVATPVEGADPTLPDPQHESLGADAASAEIDFAAAEAEALSFDGDLSGLTDLDDADSGTTPETAGPADAAAAEYDSSSDSTTSTRVVVAGLISVASIANFKRSLARVPGVWSIGVSSGPDGEFVFTVSHDESVRLASEIQAMSTFESQITGEAEGELKVSAHDRDAAG